MKSDLEEIKARLNIIDVLGEYIRLEKAGSNWRTLCPFHNEKSPSFMVSEEKQFWHCFGCQKGGDIFSFVMEIEGMEFREALKQLAEKAGVKLAGYDPKKTEAKNRTLEILELATKFYEVQLWKGDGKTRILNYLRERGLKDETIKEFRLGYAPRGWRNVIQFLEKRGYKIGEIAKTGLLVNKDHDSRSATRNENKAASYEFRNASYYDRFRERIMFPISDYSGRVVGYSARVVPGGDESQAKYVNTPETEVYRKSHILYGLDKAKKDIKDNNFVLLVEGNMDVIAASQAGIKNVVAVSGTALTLDQIKIIKRYTPRVKMFFDMDSAGYNATKKSMKLCFSSDMKVEVVSIPTGKDAADLARENPNDLKKFVGNSKNAVEYLLDKSLLTFDKNKVEDKRTVSELMIDMLSSVANSIEKNHWVKIVAEKLETSETALTDMLKKANLKNRSGKSEERGVEEKMETMSRIQILFEEATGIMLSFPDIWKKAAENKGEYVFLPKDSLPNIVLEKSEEANFDWEKLAEIITGRENKEKIAKLFFRYKYYLGLNNQLEEINPEDPAGDFEKVMDQIIKEQKRLKLEKIVSDLGRAEKEKDTQAIKFLQDEFKKILEEIHN